MKLNEDTIKSIGKAEGQDYNTLIPDEPFCAERSLFCRIVVALSIAALVVAAVTITIVLL